MIDYKSGHLFCYFSMEVLKNCRDFDANFWGYRLRVYKDVTKTTTFCNCFCTHIDLLPFNDTELEILKFPLDTSKSRFEFKRATLWEFTNWVALPPYDIYDSYGKGERAAYRDEINRDFGLNVPWSTGLINLQDWVKSTFTHRGRENEPVG